jgi:hypothetical protein
MVSARAIVGQHEREVVVEKRAHDILRSLIDTVNATGGVIRSRRGVIGTVADEDWLDLALVYLDACEVLGVGPVYHYDDDDDDDAEEEEEIDDSEVTT